MTAMEYISHPLIAKDAIETRQYQVNIAKACVQTSTLVVLPTGLGKTVIALMVIADALQRTGKKVIFLAPTKPLTEQHFEFLKKFLLVPNIAMFTGEVSPATRKKLFEENIVIVSTPQVIQNDLISNKFNLRDVGLIIFDEAHRAAGDYAYTFIGRRYNSEATRPHALGITASPGNNKAAIVEVCQNLGMGAVEIRSEFDPDVMSYVHDIRIDWVPVAISSKMHHLLSFYSGMLRERLNELRRYGLVPRKSQISTKELIAVQGLINARMRTEGKKASPLYHAMTVQAQAMKLNHAMELLETQGINSLKAYLDRLEAEAMGKGASKAAKDLVLEHRYREARRILESGGEEHPKLPYVVKIVSEELRRNPSSKIIVFTHFRDTAALVTLALSRETGGNIKPIRFVGQATHGEDKGMTQKQQTEMLDTFRSGENNVLIATSVAEEGLDIPHTDMVVFFEPVPSEIRTIQRRGRTGRHSVGRVIILITKGTRDEAYYWTARNKEKRMREELRLLKEELAKHYRVDGSVNIAGDLRTAIPLPGSDDLMPAPPTNANTTLQPSTSENGEVLDGETQPSLMFDEAEPIDDEPVPGAPTPAHDAPAEDQADAPKDVPAEEPAQTPAVHAVLDPIKTTKRQEPPPQTTAPVNPLAAILQERSAPVQKGQSRLLDFEREPEQERKDDEKPMVIVDTREFNSRVVVELSNLGIIVESAQLEVGDYVVSDRCAIERKDVEDFLASLIDKRLFAQAKRLVSVYPRPLMILEGEDLFLRRRISPEAIMGALSSLTVNFKLPIITTRDPRETALFIAVLAKKEQQEGNPVGKRGQKGHMAVKDKQEFLVEGLPGISQTLAVRLLAHFGTVERIVAATEEELTEVKGVGKQTAKDIKTILQSRYAGSEE